MLEQRAHTAEQWSHVSESSDTVWVHLHVCHHPLLHALRSRCCVIANWTANCFCEPFSQAIKHNCTSVQSWGGCNTRAISTEVQIWVLDLLRLFHNVKSEPIRYVLCLRLTSTPLFCYKCLHSAYFRSWFMIKCCIWPFDARKQEMTKSFCPPLCSRSHISTTVGWIVKKSHKDIHDPQRTKPTDFANVLTGTKWINETFCRHIIQRRMNFKFFVDSFYGFLTINPSDFGKVVHLYHHEVKEVISS